MYVFMYIQMTIDILYLRKIRNIQHVPDWLQTCSFHIFSLNKFMIDCSILQLNSYTNVHRNCKIAIHKRYRADGSFQNCPKRAIYDFLPRPKAWRWEAEASTVYRYWLKINYVSYQRSDKSTKLFYSERNLRVRVCKHSYFTTKHPCNHNFSRHKCKFVFFPV